MFSLFQFSTAEQIGLGAAGAAIVVAAQAIGGAAGLLLVLGTWRTRNRARRAATTGAPPDPTSDRTDPTDPQGESA